jgi:pteridine reductase
MAESNDIHDRVALITGGAKRIGAAIARRLHDAGMRVIVHYRQSATEAEELASELNALRKGSAATVGGDLLEPRIQNDLIDSAVSVFDRLDLLVNNASSFYPTPLGRISESDWDDLMGSNLKAPLFLSQSAAPHLRKRRGQIINMVDIYARRPLAHHTVYCVAKAGLAMLTFSLARELGPEIRVNGIAPGAIIWPEQGLDESSKKKMLDQTALATTGEPDDIARCAMFLARDAGYVTGQIIAVDGGRSLGW